jgi:hypothetical protein
MTRREWRTGCPRRTRPDVGDASRSASSTPTRSSAAVTAAMATSSSSPITPSRGAAFRPAATKTVVCERSAVPGRVPDDKTRTQLPQLVEPDAIGRCRPKDPLDGVAVCSRGRFDPGDRSAPARNEERLTALLDRVEQLREPARGLGRSQTLDMNRIYQITYSSAVASASSRIAIPSSTSSHVIVSGGTTMITFQWVMR